jgi:hypothetical protein
MPVVVIHAMGTVICIEKENAERPDRSGKGAASPTERREDPASPEVGECKWSISMEPSLAPDSSRFGLGDGGRPARAESDSGRALPACWIRNSESRKIDRRDMP